MFVTTVIKCHLLSYDIFNANYDTLTNQYIITCLTKTTQPVINMT